MAYIRCMESYFGSTKKNSPNDLDIRLALLLHDIGKPFSYQDDESGRHFKNHALKK